MIRAEINGTKQKKNEENHWNQKLVPSKDQQNWEILARLTSKKREKAHIIKIGNERGDTITEL